jgi:hypothetical protein
MVKEENQRNASVLACKLFKDHYVANPFAFTSVQVRVHGPSNRPSPALSTPLNPGSHQTVGAN